MKLSPGQFAKLTQWAKVKYFPNWLGTLKLGQQPMVNYPNRQSQAYCIISAPEDFEGDAFICHPAGAYMPVTTSFTKTGNTWQWVMKMNGKVVRTTDITQEDGTGKIKLSTYQEIDFITNDDRVILTFEEVTE